MCQPKHLEESNAHQCILFRDRKPALRGLQEMLNFICKENTSQSCQLAVSCLKCRNCWPDGGLGPAQVRQRLRQLGPYFPTSQTY
jgi:hypothetical protein